MLPTKEGWCLNHWTSREAPTVIIMNAIIDGGSLFFNVRDFVGPLGVLSRTTVGLLHQLG